MYLKLDEVPVVVASSADAAREVTETHDLNFTTRPCTPTIWKMRADGQGVLFAPYGVHHTEDASWSCSVPDASGRSAMCGSLPGEAVNVDERIATAITDSTMSTMLGDRFERREEFLEELAEVIKLASGFSLDDLFPSWRLASAINGIARRAEEHYRKNYELMECAFWQN